MVRKKKKKSVSKYLEDACLVTTTITRIDILNLWSGDKYKSVFYAASSNSESGERMCIVWGGKYNLQIGDTVELVGRISGDVFLCWKLHILKRAEENSKVVNG